MSSVEFQIVVPSVSNILRYIYIWIYFLGQFLPHV